MTKRKEAAACLSGKVCYLSRSSAEQVRAYSGGHGRVYRCECGAYHLTSSAHRGTARGRERAKQRQRQWRA